MDADSWIFIGDNMKKLTLEDIEKYGTEEEKVFLKEYNDFAPEELRNMIDKYGPVEIFRAIYEWAKEKGRFDLADFAAHAHSELSSGNVYIGVTEG